MAGLNNIITNKAVQQTTMPAWYDAAQQDIVNQAKSAVSAAPTPSQTVAQGAVNKLSQPNNAFSQAANVAQDIASGAANPWIVNQSTGQITPNTQTALGGLFQAQNQQLQQLLPNIAAPIEGGNIASGQFGSLRGQTATNKAIADAQAQLFSQQMQAALQNQATGVNAASTAGNLTNQEIKSLLETGQYEQAAPFINASNYAKLIGSIQAPTTVTNQTKLSPLNQIAGIISLLGGADGKGGILKSIGVEGGLADLVKYIGKNFPGGGGSSGGGGGVINTGTGEDWDMGGGGGSYWEGGGGVIDTGTGEDWNMG